MLYLGWAHDVLVDAQGCADPHGVTLGVFTVYCTNVQDHRTEQ